MSFFSPWDFIYVGAGTTVFGTCDGRHCSGAGRVGFHTPSEADPDGVYGKLHQVRWRPDMIPVGNLGGQLPRGARGYVQTYVAPLIRTGLWTAQIVQDITAVGP